MIFSDLKNGDHFRWCDDRLFNTAVAVAIEQRSELYYKYVDDENRLYNPGDHGLLQTPVVLIHDINLKREFDNE